jgi:hypothetical protein
LAANIERPHKNHQNIFGDAYNCLGRTKHEIKYSEERTYGNKNLMQMTENVSVILKYRKNMKTKIANTTNLLDIN